jgi:hypothetical protein
MRVLESNGPVPCPEDRDAAYRLGGAGTWVTKERFGLDRSAPTGTG